MWSSRQGTLSRVAPAGKRPATRVSVRAAAQSTAWPLMRYGAPMLNFAALLALTLVALQSPAVISGTAPAQPAGEVLAADTPRTTVAGNTFIAPAGWRVEVRGPATILAAPEGDSHIALVDVKAPDADRAVAAAWAAYGADAKWPLKVTNDFPDKDGWSNIRDYTYQTSPEREARRGRRTRAKAATPGRSVIYDMAQAVGEKRGGQVALIFGRLLPKGYEREIIRRQDGEHARCAADRGAHGVRRERPPEARRAGRRRSAWCRTARSSSPTASACAISAGARQPDADTLYIDRVEHQGADDADAGEARRRGQADVGHAGHHVCCRRSSSATPTRRAACWSST